MFCELCQQKPAEINLFTCTECTSLIQPVFSDNCTCDDEMCENCKVFQEFNHVDMLSEHFYNQGATNGGNDNPTGG